MITWISSLSRWSGDGLNVRHSRTQGEFVAAEKQQHQYRTCQGQPAQLSHQRIRAAAHGLLGEHPSRRKRPELAADAANLFRGEAHHLRQLSPIAGTVAPAKTEQQAEIVDLEHIRQVRGIVAAEELLQMLKEDLARDVRTEQLLLQRLAEPVGENGVLQIEDGFVQERDCGEGGYLDVFGWVTGGQRLAGGCLERFAGLMTEGLRIGDALAIRAQPFDGGEDFLENERQVFRPAGTG